VKVKLNKQLIPVQSFKQYVEMFKKEYVHEGSEHWEYAVAMSSEFTQVSFVNGISTDKGGRHVDYVVSQVVKKVCEYIEKKKKVRVSPASVKEQLFVFLRCNIVNPTFDSQTKDYMETSAQNFGSVCVVSNKFIEKIANLGIMEMACTIAGAKEAKTLKKTDGTKTKIIRGITKLTDANFAGTSKSSQCIIIICEGDSAKASIMSGLTVEDKNTIGVYPLKGKVMNVRGESIKKIMENKEIAEFKRILGLETGKKYTLEDVHKHLRYGKIWILCDQDSDGSHIKGLCINMIHSLWPSLTEIPHFINFMNTPIIKCTKGQSVVSFYNPNEFRLWKESNSMTGWHTKWYKGLGTSDRKEFAKYLKDRKIVKFEHSETCDETIDMIFNKKRAENRKEWLSSYDRTSCLDTSKETVSFTEFIHKEFKHFSNADNDRSIPSLVDGLKESQRKVLFGAFKRNLTVECKVSQISGYISEHSCYHHGEMSLNQTIVGMAQDFVGSNNINLLAPKGQFGTRMKGGKDFASPRYIFTALSNNTRQIFPKDDDNVLEYLEDDGVLIEPRFYVPIIPMILVNGTKGIGTGYSTDIPCFNPLQIVGYIKNKLAHKDNDNVFIPYYKGFKGTIEPHGPRFLIKGKYEVGEDKIEITELPVGLWTDDYKEYLESLTDTIDKDGNKINPIVKDYDDLCNDLTVRFSVTLHKGRLAELIQSNTLEKVFKLATTQSITNMHLFNGNGELTKYSCVADIIDDYFDIRYEMYEKRKQYLIEKIKEQLLFLENRVRYIHEMLDETIKLHRKSAAEIDELLESKGYNKLGDSCDYKYLTRMYMDSVSLENVGKINQELQNKREELEILERTTVEEWWLRELDAIDFSLPEAETSGKKKRKLIIKD
jgi:DNA topoisomerase-2